MTSLLIIAHAPSPNTQVLRDALQRGASDPEIDGIAVEVRSPFDAEPDHIKAATGLILFTTENLGYMSGALKDCFDRIYYPCLEETQGRPYALVVRAGHDGTGTCRAVASITTGLRWKAVQEPLVCRGAYDPAFETKCENVGRLMAAGLETGIF